MISVKNRTYNALGMPVQSPFRKYPNITFIPSIDWFQWLFCFQDHEDPDVWCGKQGGNVPVLMLDKQHCYVIVGKCILSKLEVRLLPEAVVAFMATFYLLDFDYPINSMKLEWMCSSILYLKTATCPKTSLCASIRTFHCTRSSKPKQFNFQSWTFGIVWHWTEVGTAWMITFLICT